MYKRDIVQWLNEDQQNGKGLILDVTKEGVNYYDYENDETFYRSHKYCTLKWLSSIIYIGEEGKKKGLDEYTIAKMLKAAYGDSFEDAICTLRGIIIYSTEEDFAKGVERFCPDDDLPLLLSEFSYNDMEILNACGRKWHRKQLVFINERAIADTSTEGLDEFFGYVDNYSLGIYETIIHETRHIMMDTNMFLDMEKYPISDAAEEAVENFCRCRYDRLPKELKLVNMPKELIP